jgi:hypothetical protein
VDTRHLGQQTTSSLNLFNRTTSSLNLFNRTTSSLNLFNRTTSSLNLFNQAAAVQPANHQHDAAQLQDGHPQLVGDQNVLQIPAIKPKLQAELILKPELRRSPRKNKGTPPKYLKDYIC